MAGGKGQIKRRAAKSAAAIGESAPTRPPLKEWAPAVKAEEEAAGGFADGGKPAAAKNRMPKEHVKWILAQKPLAPPPRYAALKRSNPDLTPRPGEELDEATRRLYYVIAKAFYEMEEWFPSEQERVRQEMATKGYVEVTDEWLRERAEFNDMVDREWPKIQANIDEIVRNQRSYCEVDENDSESDQEDEED